MPRAPKSTNPRASRTNPLQSKSKSAKNNSTKQKKVTTTAAAGAGAEAGSTSTDQETAASSSLDQEDANQITKSGGTADTDTETNYLLHVHMTLSSDPMINRLLSVPPRLTFEIFHEVLQTAFGWASCHMHNFIVTLSDVKNPYPRRVMYLEPLMSRDDLLPDCGYIRKPESEFTLHDVFSHAIFSREDVFGGTEWEGTKVTPEMELRILYEYDMGDGWTHQITLLGRADPGLHRALGGPNPQAVLCLGGEGHPCAEDCGSEPGWEHLKEVFAKPKKKDPDDLKDWYKTVCANGDPEGLNPWKWNIFAVNMELETVKI